MRPKKIYHFISHTHWDREWYQTFEQFRYKLVNLIDNLLDLLDRDPEFKYFHLDGQTIVLQDYYTLRPGKKERLENYIREGRILIGPWYQQNDLYLTSAESTVRNLIEGIGTSRKLGGEMKVGYLPDHFGLIGQMPQIFQSVGLDNCVHGRGFDYGTHKAPFFRWRSPDGSEVTNVFLYHWYNSAQRLPNDTVELKSMFDGMREREEKMNPSPHYAMMNGVDHLEAQDDLPEVLGKLREMYGEEIEFVHDTMPNLVKGVQEYMKQQPDAGYPVIEGELREAFEYSILAGTLSSRVYIKQANLECHDLVEKWMEPLSVWCRMMDLDHYEADTIRYYWRLYMENHPHDSICGCSQDAVHDQMMDRYGRLKELAREVIGRKLTILAKQISSDGFGPEDIKLLVVNTAQQEASMVEKTAVYFLAEDDVQDFSILDEQGNSLPYRMVSEQPSRMWIISPINLPGDLKVKRFDIEWQPQAPALGYNTYRVRPHQTGLKVNDAVAAAGGLKNPILENERLKVEVQLDGTFHLKNKKTGVVVKNQGQIQDAGDGGDLYVFSETSGERYDVWKDQVEIVSLIVNDLYHECTYRFTWHLPEGLDETRINRKTSMTASEFQVTLRLDKDAAQVNLKVEVNNQAKDHRVRVLFPSATVANYVWAGGQFDVVQRSWDSGKEWKRDANSQAFWKWFAPVYEDGGVAVFAKGLHDYEMIHQGRTAGVTLLRCVETINVRETIYLEQDYQPKGQCLGKHTFELAVRPFSGESSTRLYQEAERFHQGMITKQFAIDEDRWSKGRAWVQDSRHKGTFKPADPNAHKPRLPLRDTFINVDGDVMVSAMKWSEDGENPILRLYNVEDNASSVKLSAPHLADEVVVTNLLEEAQGKVSAANQEVKTELAAKKFVTYRL
ncbi:MAG TPA: glycosyl hydrolase-related protein [Bacilli bacterium]